MYCQDKSWRKWQWQHQPNQITLRKVQGYDSLLQAIWSVRLINKHGKRKSCQRNGRVWSPCTLYLWALGLMKGDFWASFAARCISQQECQWLKKWIMQTFLFGANYSLHDAHSLQKGCKQAKSQKKLELNGVTTEIDQSPIAIMPATELSTLCTFHYKFKTILKTHSRGTRDRSRRRRSEHLEETKWQSWHENMLTSLYWHAFVIRFFMGPFYREAKDAYQRVGRKYWKENFNREIKCTLDSRRKWRMNHTM